MIIQACLNGARPSDYHTKLPLTADLMASDAAACVAAGAHEIHVHPRAPDGRESLTEIDTTIEAMRRVCPGTLIGVSTGDWIAGDPLATRAAIAAWHVLPDYASVNLSEDDAPAIIELLRSKGVGIEAGLASVEDAQRFVSLGNAQSALRVLIEIEEQELDKANRVAEGIASVLGEAKINKPILLHGFDATVWHFVNQARAKSWSTRVGLEDGKHLPDGSVARDNAQIVQEALRLYRDI